MNKENCALKLVDEIILYYDARSKKHQITYIACLRYNRMISDYRIREDMELCRMCSNTVSSYFHGRCEEKKMRRMWIKPDFGPGFKPRPSECEAFARDIPNATSRFQRPI